MAFIIFDEKNQIDQLKCKWLYAIKNNLYRTTEKRYNLSL